ncbi:MAG: hypothetical protein H7X93_09720 [Sphingomonadaceae bacterium]|nr:hypothetical protein [Sphingomonadaceae bacterium]
MSDEQTKQEERERDKRQEKELEQGLKESFPASDPPANAQPGHNDPAPSSGYDEAKEEEELRKSNP